MNRQLQQWKGKTVIFDSKVIGGAICTARERKEVLMPAIGVGAPKEPVLFLAILVIAGLERLIVLVQDLPQGGNWKSITRLDSLIIPPVRER